jgi:hypothetical protein
MDQRPRCFFLHVGKKPHLKMWLTLIDRNGNYVPGNVQWTTPSKTCRNKTNNHKVEILGETLTLSDAADKVGLNRETVRTRLDELEMNEEEALTKPVPKKYLWEGEMLFLSEICRRTGMKYNTLHARIIYHHMTLEQAVVKPVETKYHPPRIAA